MAFPVKKSGGEGSLPKRKLISSPAAESGGEEKVYSTFFFCECLVFPFPENSEKRAKNRFLEHIFLNLNYADQCFREFFFKAQNTPTYKIFSFVYFAYLASPLFSLQVFFLSLPPPFSAATGKTNCVNNHFLLHPLFSAKKEGKKWETPVGRRGKTLRCDRDDDDDDKNSFPSSPPPPRP